MTVIYLFELRKGLCHFSCVFSIYGTFVFLKGKLISGDSILGSIVDLTSQGRSQSAICKTNHLYSWYLFDTVTLPARKKSTDGKDYFFLSQGMDTISII